MILNIHDYKILLQKKKKGSLSFFCVCAVGGLPFFDKVDGGTQICKRFRITDLTDEITETFFRINSSGTRKQTPISGHFALRTP
jgi:hypothetical protein